MTTREPQYAACLQEAPVTLGPMTGATWRWNPRRLGMMLARYKFVAKMLDGVERVAEIGCGDGFGAAVVREAVGRLDLYDFDETWAATARTTSQCTFATHDIVDGGPLPRPRYQAIYMLDVLEHIAADREPGAMANIQASLSPGGVFIAGCPSVESQAYASEISRAGHVNCRNGEVLRAAMRAYFRNVFLFGMNDEVLHTGFAPMCHYLLVVCCGSRVSETPPT